MKYNLLIFLFFFIGSISAKEKFQINNEQRVYLSYFKEAYEQFPLVPNGVLEAISWTNTHMRNIDPSKEPESCTGMPMPYGVMGLFANGKGWFRENLKTVSNLSGFSMDLLKNDPKSQIMGFAQAYQKLAISLNVPSGNPNDHIAILIALSELPNSELLNDYAMDSYVYSVLSFLNESDNQEKFGFPNYNIDLQNVFKENWPIVTASHLTASSNGLSNGTTNYNPNQSLNKTASTDYAPALWNATTCNFSSRAGTAITHYAIHTVQGSYAGCISWFKNCSASASAHYVIRSSDGQVTQMILESDKAWHIGSENPYTIGTEHEGYIADASWYTTAMYGASADLAKDIVNSGYNISGLRTFYGPGCDGSSASCGIGACTKIKGHQMFPNQTHTDPGQYWNWEYFYTLINTLTPTTNVNCSGTFTDPGAAANYANDVRQAWVFNPANSTSLTMTFSTFNIEANYDKLWIYNGLNSAAPLLGVYTGTTSPGTVTASSGKMYIEFRSDCATNASGWDATWVCTATDVTPPTTTITNPSTWKTTDFNVSFTDNDNVGGSGIAEKYYQVLQYKNSKWVGNNQAGFIYDNFDGTGLETYYTNAIGTWANTANSLVQTDETNSNTNLWATYPQTSTNNYIYEFKMKIEGTGTTRRAGFHFFCDNGSMANRNNSYFVFFRADDNKLQIYETVADVFTMKADLPLTVVPAVFHNVRVHYSPTTGLIQVYFNNVLAGTWTDTTPLTAGSSISFRTGNAKTTYDDFRIYRTRTATALIGVGTAATKEIMVENVNPTTPACKVRAFSIDNYKNWSTIVEQTSNVDRTAPSTVVTVNDGTGADIATTSTAGTLSANWTTSTDVQSNVARYDYAIGTTSGGTNILTWTSNALNTTVTTTGLTLVNGTTYYISVRSVNNAGLISAIKSSNGQTFSSNGCGSDIYEANETELTAKLITTNSTKYGLICPVNDEDWYYFSNNASNPNIKVTLTNLIADYDVELYDFRFNLIRSSVNAGTASESIIYNAAPVNNYFIRVYGYSGAFNSTSQYNLLATIGPKALAKTESFEDIDSQSLSIYPNPASDKLTMKFSTFSEEKTQIQLFDALGKLVYSESKEASKGENLMVIDLNAFNSGMYFVKITQGDFSKTDKLMISK